MPLIVKRKVANFFHDDDKHIINQAVHDCHTIIQNASRLIRYYYLSWISEQRDIPSEYLEIDNDLVRMACIVVQGEIFHPRNGKDKDKKVRLFNDLQKVFQKLSQKHTDITYKSSLSLTHILSYNQSQLVTAYNNNITEHFPKYVKRCIKYDLIKKGYEKSKSARIAWKIMHGFMNNNLQGMNDDEEISSDDVVLQFIDEKYKHFFPPLYHHKKKKTGEIYYVSRYYDLQVYPMTYLYYMVLINKEIEENHPDGKLYQPLPFHHSFIPMHIRLDTSGIAQLLMDKTKITMFKNLCINVYNEEPRISDKKDFLASTNVIFPTFPMSDCEKHDYATFTWMFLTNMYEYKNYDAIFHTRTKTNTEYVFDNAIVTDGISIGFQITEKDKRKRKEYKTKKTEDEKEDDNTCDKKSVRNTGKKRDLTNTQMMDKKHGSCDIGKNNIAVVTDGIKVCRYTRKQRNHDTCLFVRRKVTIEKRKEHGVEDIECHHLSEYSPKSCNIIKFEKYCDIIEQKKKDLQHTYIHPYFRQTKFMVYSKTKSSEMKFIDKVWKMFKDGYNTREYKNGKYDKCATESMKHNASKTITNRSDFIIAIGTGGSGMNNLKGTESSPNKKIQRTILSFFENSQGQEEMYTSKTCPCCKEISLKPKTCIHGNKCKKQEDRGKSYSKHGLLCCTNIDCKRSVWNRDLTGSFNILVKFHKRIGYDTCINHDNPPLTR